MSGYALCPGGTLEVLRDESAFDASGTARVAYRLCERTEALLQAHQLDYEINWSLSGQPFLTPSGELVDAAVASIREVTGIETELSTSGGTSDGRFIAPSGAQVVELGPINATIHKLNEEVHAPDLPRLTAIYRGILAQLLTGAN